MKKEEQKPLTSLQRDVLFSGRDVWNPEVVGVSRERTIREGVFLTRYDLEDLWYVFGGYHEEHCL